MSDGYPKRLVEVDFPIKTVSINAREEKNLRSGHPWHLHIWWARRPWGACRAIELACLLPDPADPKCPGGFIADASSILTNLGYKTNVTSPITVRKSLLQFIGHISAWTVTTKQIVAARTLVKAANPQSTPVLCDSFSGNGAIPAEALRLGCNSIAIDLNPVANLIMKVLLEAVPKYGISLLENFRRGAEYTKQQAKLRLSAYYPPPKNGKTPIAWLWARTVVCEGPSCGATIPLISQTLISKGKQKVWIEIKGDSSDKTVSIKMRTGSTVPNNLIKTAGGGAAVCPVCGMTTPKSSVKRQGIEGQMGQRVYGVALPIGERQGKYYVDAIGNEQQAFESASLEWRRLIRSGEATELTEKYPFHDPRAFTAGLYGTKTWGDMFSERQKLALHILVDTVKSYSMILKHQKCEPGLINAVTTTLSLSISNCIHYWTTMSAWLAEHMVSCFITGNAIAMRWDWAEANPLVSEYVGGLDYAFGQAESAISSAMKISNQSGTILQGNAIDIPLPDDSVDLFFTDPPYYDVVPYSDLSDLCYIWLRRFLGSYYPDLLSSELTPKAEEIVVNACGSADGRDEQTSEHYRMRMAKAFGEGRRIMRSDGIGSIVFAHKGTDAWEALLAAAISAGFVVTASWPIDTERAARMRANKSAALASSVHLIVRPRAHLKELLGTPEIGDWRDVLQELPQRIHEWLPRLAKEGIVGADAIFSCLGPALEVFSRYSKVEKASGEQVPLREYLEHVWAAVSREALNMIFEGADATGFEEDARLTAMWLWTLSAGTNGNGTTSAEAEELDQHEAQEKPAAKISGFILEYDAARKIAQGLGAHLENLTSLVEIKGSIARLLPVSDRADYLFGKKDDKMKLEKSKAKAGKQLTFADVLGKSPGASQYFEGVKITSTSTKTTLDLVHQSMLLFAMGESGYLKSLLFEEGAGTDPMFWRLAQALSALYPSHTAEKRWIDGVMARKKTLGL